MPFLTSELFRIDTGKLTLARFANLWTRALLCSTTCYVELVFFKLTRPESIFISFFSELSSESFAMVMSDYLIFASIVLF